MADIMKKKVFFAINNLGMGGAENMLIEQVRYLDKSKFEALFPCQTERSLTVSNYPWDIHHFYL